MVGKCPKCEKLIASVNANEIRVNSGTNSWVGITYNCPFCFTVLSVAIDPVALKTDSFVASKNPLLMRKALDLVLSEGIEAANYFRRINEI
jgi:hypothetical protein